MQKFKEFSVLYSSPQDKALADLGIDKNDEDYLDKCTIDLNEVESFCKCADLFNGAEMARVQLRSGDVWTIRCSYEEFKTFVI